MLTEQHAFVADDTERGCKCSIEFFVAFDTFVVRVGYDLYIQNCRNI